METAVLIGNGTLEDLIASGVNKALAVALPKALRQVTRKEYLTKTELMTLTGWSSRTVEYRKSSGSIPYIRRDRLCLFPTDEILAWLEEGRVPAKEAQL